MKKPLALAAILAAAVALAACGRASSASPLLGSAAASSFRDFYVSPDGRWSGDGSRDRPWDLKTALSHPSRVRPGDTIWLRGGTYRGVFVSRLTGTAEAPIRVRQYAGERAIVDGGDSGGSGIFVVSGAYTWYWGFEVMSSNSDRVSAQVTSWPTDLARGEAVQIEQTAGSGVGVKFINMVVHDARQGFSFWKEAVDAEIYGCLIYNNGWIGPDRGHGHGIYTQNQTGRKTIADNVVFNNFGYGVHAYGSSAAYLNNFTFQGNAAFNNGAPNGEPTPNIFVGGGASARGIAALDNMTYCRPFHATTARFGSDAANGDLRLEGNTFVGFTSVRNWAHVLVANNTFIGSTTVAEFAPPDRGMVSKTSVWDRNRYVSQEARWQPFALVASSPRGLAFPDWRKATGFDAASLYVRGVPSGTRVFLRPNRYEEGRAHIVIYDWTGASSVGVDPRGVLRSGDQYEIRDAQRFFGPPVASGVYRGSPIRVPLQPRGSARPGKDRASGSSGPEFSVFVLLRGTGGRS